MMHERGRKEDTMGFPRLLRLPLVQSRVNKKALSNPNKDAAQHLPLLCTPLFIFNYF